MKTLKFSFLVVLLASLFFSCQKEYSLEGVVTPAGTWQFNDAATLYSGNIDSAYIETSGTTKTLVLKGKSADGKQTFLMNLYATDSFTVGTYQAAAFNSDFQYFTQAKTLYEADGLIGPFSVTITAIGNNSVTGTFSGDAQDSTGAIKPITLGKFTSRINLSTNGTGGGGGGTASGSLGASAGVCTPITTAGTFTQGTVLTSANTATVQVTVTTPGTYTISTNTVNGVSFSKSGTFTAAGSQSVILVGSGTPVASGNQTFTVTFGTSTCTFVVNFLPGTVPPVVDYFPTTVNSYWAYGLQGGTTSDSFMIKVSPATLSAAGNTYTAFTLDDIPPSGSPDSLFYRKGSGLYYEYFNTEDFFGYDAGTANPKFMEYIFLKDNVAVGTTWNSPNVTGMSSGTSFTIFIKMTLFEKVTTTTTVGSATSNDILKMRYEYFVTIAPGSPFFTEERWFAKNIGMIYNSFNDGTNTDIYKVGRYQVF